MECGGKRSATPLWIVLEFRPSAASGEIEFRLRGLRTKAPLPLRFAGALHKVGYICGAT
jgi:hypothetical protein